MTNKIGKLDNFITFFSVIEKKNAFDFRQLNFIQLFITSYKSFFKYLPLKDNWKIPTRHMQGNGHIGTYIVTFSIFALIVIGGG